ncbi:PepSY domain-containing protein [Streptomyces sp. NPDC004539]|uniref:PepSY domain-containing protein n=1 Tax=Streptomyces sp. NPDC004539 TaxID=3154280 RepID=UPI0033B98A6B
MKRSLAITAVAVTAVLAGGTALAFAGDDGREREGAAQPVRVAAAAQEQPTVITTTTNLTAAQAIDAALKSRPGTVLSADLDTDDDDASGRGWDIEILGTDRTTYDVLVDPATGKILSTRVDTDNDDNRTPTGLTARQAAEAAAPKGTVLSIDVDDDRPGLWEIETRDAQGLERDWTVNAANGTVSADRDN